MKAWTFDMENIRFGLLDSIINTTNIEILDHGYLKGDANWKYYNVTSPFNRLYYVIDGDGYIENQKHKINLEKGKAYLIPIQSTYNYICDNTIEKFYIHFRFELFSGNDVFELIHECVTVLERVAADAVELLELCGEAYEDLKEYQLLKHIVKEQTIDENGKIKVKSKAEITTDSLQNPSDEDATFREKAGEKHKGYVGNFVETFDENGAIITSFDYPMSSS